MKIFDCLNSEKPTLMFLNLARRGSASKIIIKFNYFSSKVEENKKKEKRNKYLKSSRKNLFFSKSHFENFNIEKLTAICRDTGTDFTSYTEVFRITLEAA